ncbi:unnamed protein product, partial [Discosporangium mesarthrocarpum]
FWRERAVGESRCGWVLMVKGRQRVNDWFHVGDGTSFFFFFCINSDHRLRRNLFSQIRTTAVKTLTLTLIIQWVECECGGRPANPKLVTCLSGGCGNLQASLMRSPFVHTLSSTQKIRCSPLLPPPEHLLV